MRTGEKAPDEYTVRPSYFHPQPSYITTVQQEHERSVTAAAGVCRLEGLELMWNFKSPKETTMMCEL